MRRIWNIALRVNGAIVLIVTSAGMGLDAISLRYAPLAKVTPGMFRSVSWLRLSETSVTSASAVRASEVARSAVLARPLDPNALILSAQALGMQNPMLSSAPLGVAVKLGWRNIEAQNAVITSAVSLRAWEVAAPRIVALTRLRNLDALPPKIIGTWAVGNGYATLHSEFFNKNSEHWLYFFRWLNSKSAEEANIFFRAFPNTAKIANCEILVSGANIVAGRGALALADEVMGGSCAVVSAQTGAQLEFRDSLRALFSGPFDWKFAEHPSLSHKVYSHYNDVRLSVTNSDAVPRLFATKIVKFPPGNYKLSMDSVRKSEIVEMENIRVSVECVPSIRKNVRLNRKSMIRGIINIPERNCDYQRIFWYIGPFGEFSLLQFKVGRVQG